MGVIDTTSAVVAGVEAVGPCDETVRWLLPRVPESSICEWPPTGAIQNLRSLQYTVPHRWRLLMYTESYSKCKRMPRVRHSTPLVRQTNCSHCMMHQTHSGHSSRDRPSAIAARASSASPRSTRPAPCFSVYQGLKNSNLSRTNCCYIISSKMTVVDNVANSAEYFFNTIASCTTTHSNGFISILIMC